MDPYYEQRLRDEVIYLHSLWRQGPTTANHSSRPLQLQPSSSTQFKKKRKPPRGRRGNKSFSDIEWPVNPPAETPSAAASGWPELKLKRNPASRLPSAEEQSRFRWNQVQQKALKAAQEFFSSNADSDGDESDEDDDMMDEDGNEEEYKFLFNLFTEETELKGYYEKNYGGGGEFCCLVCGGAGEKFGKRFKDCIALVQHSVSIAKTKKRRAHRAYGQAICKVLSWNIDRLPSIVSTLKSAESQGIAGDGNKDSNVLTSNVGLINIDNDGAISEMDSNANEILTDKVPDLSNSIDGTELMVCENSLQVADAIISMDDPHKGVVNEPEGNGEGVVNSLCRNLSKRMVLEAVETVQVIICQKNNIAVVGLMEDK